MSLLRQNKPQITQITQIFVTDHHDETDYQDLDTSVLLSAAIAA